jgi:hypothetical protein
MSNEIVDQHQAELEAIKQRNLRVESDKAWETCAVRISAICGITYVVAGTLLCLIGVKEFWLSAMVPVVGFYLSTQTLPPLKRWWLKARYKVSEDSHQLKH